MSFFSRKKGFKESASALTEAEIHRKLYGEFENGSSKVIVGEQEHFKNASSPASTVSSGNPARDLFSAPREVNLEPEAPKRSVRLEVRSPDQVPRHVPLHEFEKKAAAVSSSASFAGTERFRAGAASQAPFPARLGSFFSRGFGWIRSLLDAVVNPQNLVFRRIFYWCAAVVVVFSLFWGVNILNSQREAAMKSPYRVKKEVPQETMKSSAVAAATEAQTKTAMIERPVIVTPVVPKEREVVITPAVPTQKKNVASVPSGSYAIQIVTYPNQGDADRLAETLKQDRLRAFVKEYKRPSGRIFYVVFLGPYRTETEAQGQLSRFRGREVAKPFQDAFVKSI